MDYKLVFAIITISLALVFYTIGVFGERKSKTLNRKHLIMFWVGLVFDTTGTFTMSRIAAEGTTTISAGAQMLHSATGMLAIVLMLLHTVWATWVLYKNEDAKKQAFHKFSITVWCIWLVPYIVGMIVGMSS